MSARASLILLGLLAGPAIGAPTLDPQYGNYAVIQRDRPIVLSGTAGSGERVAVALGGETRQVTAGKGGSWSARFPQRSEGGPYTITLNGIKAADEVVIGDVWLSNLVAWVTRRACRQAGDLANRSSS